MKIITVVALTILVCLSFSCTALSEHKNTLPIKQETDYEKLIKQNYKEAENSPTLIKSWTIGMLKDYKLILDHLKIEYTQSATSKTTDEKTLVCGNVLIIAHGKTLDGSKKRVISLKLVCYLFNKETLENIVIINTQENKIINGWDDLTII